MARCLRFIQNRIVMGRRRNLIASQNSAGGGNLIKFIIEEGFKPSYPVEYIAEEGMTWELWVNSSYNTSGYKLYDFGFKVMVSISGEYYVIKNGAVVASTDIIVADFEYQWG